ERQVPDAPLEDREACHGGAERLRADAAHESPGWLAVVPEEAEERAEQGGGEGGGEEEEEHDGRDSGGQTIDAVGEVEGVDAPDDHEGEGEHVEPADAEEDGPAARRPPAERQREGALPE